MCLARLLLTSLLALMAAIGTANAADTAAAASDGTLHPTVTSGRERVGEKDALICHPDRLHECLGPLDEGLRAQIPADLLSRLGHRAALVQPVNDPRIAGIVLWAPEREVNSVDLILDQRLVSLHLQQQPLLTLWHELGHLQVRALQGAVLPDVLTPFEQEWLADAYLYWRIAREFNDLSLAWQQFHRRNVQVMSDISHLSHWSSLPLQPLLTKYSAGELAYFTDFEAYCRYFYPGLKRWNETDLAEFSSLLRQLFAGSNRQLLPDYLYWRKPSLSPVITPTLIHLLGSESATRWLAQQHLLIKS